MFKSAPNSAPSPVLEGRFNPAEKARSGTGGVKLRLAERGQVCRFYASQSVAPETRLRAEPDRRVFFDTTSTIGSLRGALLGILPEEKLRKFGQPNHIETTLKTLVGAASAGRHIKLQIWQQNSR
jgi:hypothetical protein